MNATATDLITLRRHVPSGGGYGIELSCGCGDEWSPEHQFERLLAARQEPDANDWSSSDEPEPSYEDAVEVDLRQEVAALAARIATAMSGGREFIDAGGIRFDVVERLELLAGGAVAVERERSW